MKKYFRYLICIIVSSVLSGCDLTFEFEHFVETYYLLDGAPRLYRIIGSDDIYVDKSSDSYRYVSSGALKEEISEEMGDALWRYHKATGAESGSPSSGYYGAYSMYPVISVINIYSDSRWDDTHEAGDLLNDCFDLTYSSFAQYIDSNYSKKYWDTIGTPITKSVAELGPMDLRLVNVSFVPELGGDSIVISARRPTTNPEPQVLTFEWTMHTGEVYTSEIEYAPSQMSF